MSLSSESSRASYMVMSMLEAGGMAPCTHPLAVVDHHLVRVLGLLLPLLLEALLLSRTAGQWRWDVLAQAPSSRIFECIHLPLH